MKNNINIALVRTLKRHLVAQMFWRKVIKLYSAESIQEFPEGIEGWQNPMWTFTSRNTESTLILN